MVVFSRWPCQKLHLGLCMGYTSLAKTVQFLDCRVVESMQGVGEDPQHQKMKDHW